MDYDATKRGVSSDFVEAIRQIGRAEAERATLKGCGFRTLTWWASLYVVYQASDLAWAVAAALGAFVLNFAGAWLATRAYGPAPKLSP